MGDHFIPAPIDPAIFTPHARADRKKIRRNMNGV